LSDPIEHVGTEPNNPADPVSPKKSNTHPKHAKLRPARELAKVQLDLADARVELQSAANHLKAASKLEGEALAAFVALIPRPSAEDLHRENCAREQAAKIARVKAGLPAVEPKQATHGRSELDRLAAHRGKNAGSLRSTTVRR
jgi:hypothetical protein